MQVLLYTIAVIAGVIALATGSITALGMGLIAVLWAMKQ